jgi:hypothetical protein
MCAGSRREESLRSAAQNVIAMTAPLNLTDSSELPEWLAIPAKPTTKSELGSSKN